jgi:phage terminase large subunit GpA-like protein
VYVCIHCTAEIQNHQKQSMLAQGQWRATVPGTGRAAGFHLSSLYSPVGWFSWADAAEMFEQADQEKDRALLQVFINTVLGETWALRGDAPEWQRLYDRRENYRIGAVPQGGLFLTAGVDIQRDRIEVEVVAWGRGKESWSVDYQVLDGQTAESAVWEKLNQVFETHYPSESGGALPIVKFAIDSGYATPEVYSWTRSFGGDRAVVIKGDGRAPAPVGQPSPIDVGPQGQRLRWGVKVWPVNGSMIKEELYRWLRMEQPTEESRNPYPPGYCHFPQYGEEYFKQLTAEQLVTRIVKGYRRPEWQKTRDRNEALDCRVYARAAAAVYGMDRFTDDSWAALEEYLMQLADPTRKVSPSTARPIRSRWIDPNQTRNWFRR